MKLPIKSFRFIDPFQRENTSSRSVVSHISWDEIPEITAWRSPKNGENSIPKGWLVTYESFEIKKSVAGVYSQNLHSSFCFFCGHKAMHEPLVWGD